MLGLWEIAASDCPIRWAEPSVFAKATPGQVGGECVFRRPSAQSSHPHRCLLRESGLAYRGLIPRDCSRHQKAAIALRTPKIRLPWPRWNDGSGGEG